MKNIIITFCLLVCLIGKAQLYDAQWVLGYGTSVVDFRGIDTIATYVIPTCNYFSITNANICNGNGDLLFYTNGITICAGVDTLPNGSGLSPSTYTTSYDCCGLNIPQAALFIPVPGSSGLYYLFHLTNDSLSINRPRTLYYSLLDTMGSIGTVVKKNIPLLQGVALREGGMTACKHANGRDYWLVLEGYNSSNFYEFLITPDSIFGPYTQNIGPVFPRPYDVAYSKFSQDGSRFATSIIQGPIVIFNFDRCNGEFSDPVNIYHNASASPLSHPINGCASLEFSENGKYLYLNNITDVTQYSLTQSNIQDSVELYVSDSSDFYEIGMLQIANNGKIYGSTWNGGLNALHVINKPDMKGDSADFVYGGQPTLTLNSDNLPNMINYRLGPLINSGCDTLSVRVISNERDNLLRVMPNPADKYIYTELGKQGDFEFQLVNEIGQLVATKLTKQVDIFDTEHLAGGAYFIKVIDKKTGAEIATKKIAVVH